MRAMIRRKRSVTAKGSPYTQQTMPVQFIPNHTGYPFVLNMYLIRYRLCYYYNIYIVYTNNKFSILFAVYLQVGRF